MAARDALQLNVRYLMDKHGDTQASLAKRAGVSQSNVYYVVSSDRHVRLDTVEAISYAYGLGGWQLINPDLPQSLIDSPALSRLVSAYAQASDEGRRFLDQIVERESTHSKP